MNEVSIKLSEEFINFSNKLKINRIKAGTDNEYIGHSRITKIIVKFFKLNNDSYLKLIKMEESKNA